MSRYRALSIRNVIIGRGFGEGVQGKKQEYYMYILYIFCGFFFSLPDLSSLFLFILFSFTVSGHRLPQ